MDRFVFVAVIDGVEYEYVCELDTGTPDGEPAAATGTPEGEPAAAAGTPDGEPAAQQLEPRKGNRQQQLGPRIGNGTPEASSEKMTVPGAIF